MAFLVVLVQRVVFVVLSRRQLGQQLAEGCAGPSSRAPLRSGTRGRSALRLDVGLGASSCCAQGLRREPEHFGQLVGRKFGQPIIARTYDPFGQVALRFDHLVDPLLERAYADQLAHLDVAALTDAEGAVGCLVLDRRVPPAVEVDYVVGRGEVEPGAPRPSARGP